MPSMVNLIIGVYNLPTHVLGFSVLGLGLFAAPLVSTQFARIPRWPFHYLVSLGLAMINTSVLAWIFRFRSLDGA